MLISFFKNNFLIILGSFTDITLVYSIKLFLNSIGSSNYSFEKDNYFLSDFRFFYLLMVLLII